jgi:hypothetical protein
MASVQNKGGTTGGVTGRGFRPGRSGNPGGRPLSLAKATRELVGEDGMKLVELWWSIASPRNSGGYGLLKFDPLGMVAHPSRQIGHRRPSAQVSTKAGTFQLGSATMRS